MEILDIGKYENVKILDVCDSEIIKVIKGFGYKNDFLKWFYHCVSLLNMKEFDYNDYPLRFEKLKGNKERENNLYSITYRKNQMNIRILYNHEKSEKPKLLLCTFYEKNKKDYKKSIDKAITRLNIVNFMERGE